MSRQIIAIDIRNTSIAAVVLSTGLKSSTIEACTQVALPDDTPEENRLSAGLATLLQTQGIPESATVAVCMPADRTIYRTVFVPFKEEKKIRQVLPFELEPNLPIAPDELIIDYQKSPETEKNGVLATAIDRRQVDQVMETLTAANLRPQLVVPGDYPLALGLTIYIDQMEDQALLLNVGARRTTLFALKDKRVALVRSIASDTGTDGGIEALALKIRQTLTAFADSGPDGYSAKALYLSGPVLTDGSVGARLAKALNLAPQMVDLRSSAAKVDTAPALDQWQACVYDNALALALIEAEGRPCPNFHRSSSTFRKYWTTYRPYIRVPAVLLSVVLLLSLAGILLESHMLKQRADQVNAQIEALFAATFPQTRRVGDALDQMKSELKKAQGSTIDPAQTVSQVRTIDILFQLSQLIPKDVEVILRSLVLGNDGLTVSGETSAYNIVDDIKVRLEKSELFKQVTIASSNMDKAGSKVLFKLKIDL